MRLQSLRWISLLVPALLAQLALNAHPAEAKSKKHRRRPASAAAAATTTSPAATAADSASSPEKPAQPSGVQFDRAEGGTLYFKVASNASSAQDADSKVKTELFDLALLGSIEPREAGLPWFVFSARPCQECIQDRSIYLIRPTQREKPIQLVHPGKIIDSKSGEKIFESRAFFGRCLRNVSGDVYTVFQQERVDRRHRLQSSVFIAEPLADRLSERLIERGLPRLDHTLQTVRRKQCQEIEGRFRRLVKKPLDLRSRAKRAADEAADDDDETDEPTKENQTDAELPASSE